MIWWAMVAGGLIGLSASGFGLVFGAVAGLLMGFWLQNIVRQEIERARDADIPHFRLEDRLEKGAEPPPPAPAPAPDIAAPPPRKKAAKDQPSPQEVPPRAMAMEEHVDAGAVERSDFGSEPGLAEQLVQRAMGWLLGGNTIVRVGLVVLFIGLAFLARFVANAGLFPIEVRLALVGITGAALLAIGFWKRIDRPDFGLHLQGGGVAVMYLTVFAAARVYDVLPAGAAFGFMIVFAALGAALAVLQNSQVLALGSFLGGYAIPVMLGGKAETPLGLFTYISILNLAILGIAWRRSWRPLNLLGFFATFVLAGAWGFGGYEDRHFWICEFFLGLSIAIYLATALLYAHNTPGKLGNFADSTLLFGTALSGFGLQATLVHDQPLASAWSAIAFGSLYLATAAWAFRRRDKGMGLLSESLLVIGVGFVTLAIPLALDAQWTSAAWALEGAGAFWIGARQARWMPRAFGLLLQLAGAVLVIVQIAPVQSSVPVLNNGVLGPLLIALPMILSAWLLRAELAHSGSRWALSWRELERHLEQPVFLAGYALGALAIVQEVNRAVPPSGPDDFALGAYPDALVPMILMLALLAQALLSHWQGHTRDWAVATWPGRISLVLIAYAFLITMAEGRTVVTLPDLFGWVLALGAHLWMLRNSDRDHGPAPSRWNGLVHAGGVWLALGLLANAMFDLIDRMDLWDSSWSGVVYLVAGTLVLALLIRWAGSAAARDTQDLAWPLHPHARAYWWRAAAPLAIALYLGALLAAVLAEGITDPLPYLPLLNPVDLSIGLVLVRLGLWRRTLLGARDLSALGQAFTGTGSLAMGALLGFVWINTVWMRTAHHLLGTPWGGGALDSPVVLTGFSILWTLMAMGLMLLARARRLRLPWIAGASLLAAVVAKLLFIDMSSIEGFARIIAFMGVGVLMLLIGYFVPIPPAREGDEA